MSPVQTRRLPPDRPPHFLDYSVPPCLLLLLFLSSQLLSFLLHRGSPLLSSSDRHPGGFSLIFTKSYVGVFLVGPLVSCLCRPPALWAALTPCVLPPLAHSDSQLLLSENQEAACPTYTQSRIGSGRAGEETAGVGRAQGREVVREGERTEGVRL